MKIKSLSIRNFYSVENLKLNLAKYKGIVFVEGRNKDVAGSNGSGKSVIFEAIVWGIFGRTIRKSTEEALVNNKNKKDCEVIIEMDNGVVIRRTKRPTFLSFTVDGKELTKESVPVTQSAIEDYLGVNYKTFLTAVVFGQSNEMDFISSSLEDKRTIIRNFLNLEEVFSLREKIKKDKAVVSADLKSTHTLEEEYLKNLANIDTSVDVAKVEILEIKSKNNILSSITLNEILELENDKKFWKGNQRIASDSYDSLNNEIKLKTKELSLKTKTKENKCDSCGTILGKITKKDLDSLKIEISRLEDTKDKSIEKFNLSTEKLNAIKIPIPSSEYYKLEKLNVLEGEIKSFESLRKTYSARLTEVSESKKVLLKRHEILKFWEIIFSEQGLVKYVIRSILDYFNNRVSYYLSYLTNGKFNIAFDDSLEERIKVNGSETNYFSLSGGERKKINLSVLLALQSILDFNAKSKNNILLLDEVVESIDDETIAGLSNLLIELSKDKLILIISHNNTLKDIFADKPRINVIKKNGITKLVS